MILLDAKEIEAIPATNFGGNVDDFNVVKATAKKILIQLQAIYNLPDEGMFHEKMGEFIKELMEEVK